MCSLNNCYLPIFHQPDLSLLICVIKHAWRSTMSNFHARHHCIMVVQRGKIDSKLLSQCVLKYILWRQFQIETMCVLANLLLLTVVELALRVAATLAFSRAEDMRLAEKLFWDDNDWATPEEALIDWRRADWSWICRDEWYFNHDYSLLS